MQGTPRPRAALVVGALIVAAAAVANAFYAMFSTFQAYDDEGYLLVSLQSFLDGGELYDDVYTQYGPVYYLIIGGFLKVLGIAPSTDAGRFMTLGVWLLVPAILAVAAWVATRRGVVAAVCGVTAYGIMPMLIPEPTHPVGLTTVLVALFTLAVVKVPTRPRVAWPAMGVLLALITLTKVNIGAFAALAVGFAAIAALQRGTDSRLARIGAAALVVLPVLLVSADLTERSVYNLLLLVLGGAACVCVLLVGRPGSPEGRDTLPRGLRTGVAAMIATALVVVGVTLALGTSVSAFVDGLLVEPSKLRDVFTVPFTVSDSAAWWVCLAVFAALAIRWREDRRIPAGPVGVGIRAAAAFATIVTLAQVSPLTVGPPAGAVMVGALVLWLILVPPTGVTFDARALFVRTSLVLLGVLELLQAYPVAGTQVRAASVAFVVPAGILIADALQELRAWSAARSRAPSRTAVAVPAVTAAALVLTVVIQPLITGHNAWKGLKPVVTAGSSTLHLPPDRADGYEELARTVRRECDALLTLPGFNSLYLWSGVKPPTGLNAGTWMLLLDVEQQQRVVDAVRDTPRTCLVRNGTQLDGWLQGRPLPDRPLARFVTTQFGDPRSFVGGQYELLTRTEATP